jgi:hypothetical protein
MTPSIASLLNWLEFLLAVTLIASVFTVALNLSALISARLAAIDRAQAARDRAVAAQCRRRAYARERDLSEIQDELVEYLGGPDEEADGLCGCDLCETERYHKTLSTCVVVQRGESLT